MGAEAIIVDKLAEVGPVLRKAIDMQNEGKTCVIEIVCTRELGNPFRRAAPRRDALAKPVRPLEKYKDHVQASFQRATCSAQARRRIFIDLVDLVWRPSA